MIALSRRPIDDTLRAAIVTKIAEYQELLDSGAAIPESLQRAYNTPEMKQHLLEETQNKCAYCESLMRHVDYGDIEHIVPKTRSAKHRFDHTNLTIACGVCNTGKGTYDSQSTPLLNPFEDVVEQHLFPLGPLILRVPGSDRGLVTERRLALNRAHLVERRTERIQSLGSLLDQIEQTKKPEVREVLEEQVVKECDDDGEFVFVVRAYVHAARQKVV